MRVEAEGKVRSSLGCRPEGDWKEDLKVWCWEAGGTEWWRDGKENWVPSGSGVSCWLLVGWW